MAARASEPSHHSTKAEPLETKGFQRFTPLRYRLSGNKSVGAGFFLILILEG